jgi:MYXO-CTERM domain-containing protein
MTTAVGDANHGGAYSWNDGSVKAGKTYYFRIEAVDHAGASFETGLVQIVIPNPGCGVVPGDAAGGLLALALLAVAALARRRAR